MSRIAATDNYFADQECPLADCERLYCPDHRLLFRSCDTAFSSVEGDRDVIGGRRRIYESNSECPECLRECRLRRTA